MRRLPRVLAVVSACGLVALAALTVTAAERRRPNVVVFLADDAGWGDYGVSGNPDVRTPYIDSLAREQEKFRQQFTQAFGATPFGPLLEDQVRRNMDMFKQAFSMFTPFARRDSRNTSRRCRPAGNTAPWT